MDAYQAMDLPRRWFRHGDLREDGLVFCVRCDLFHDIEHEHWVLADEPINLKLFWKGAEKRYQPNPKRFYRSRHSYNIFMD